MQQQYVRSRFQTPSLCHCVINRESCKQSWKLDSTFFILCLYCCLSRYGPIALSLRHLLCFSIDVNHTLCLYGMCEQASPLTAPWLAGSENNGVILLFALQTKTLLIKPIYTFCAYKLWSVYTYRNGTLSWEKKSESLVFIRFYFRKE